MSLHEVIEAYIAFKRGLGVRLESEAGVLRAFSRSMGDTDIEAVTPAAVLAFIASHWKTKELLEARAEMIRNRR